MFFKNFFSKETIASMDDLKIDREDIKIKYIPKQYRLIKKLDGEIALQVYIEAIQNGSVISSLSYWAIIDTFIEGQSNKWDDSVFDLNKFAKKHNKSENKWGIDYGFYDHTIPKNAYLEETIKKKFLQRVDTIKLLCKLYPDGSYRIDSHPNQYLTAFDYTTQDYNLISDGDSICLTDFHNDKSIYLYIKNEPPKCPTVTTNEFGTQPLTQLSAIINAFIKHINV